VNSKRFLTVVAWSVGAVSLACFAAAWILAVRNRDLSDISADFGPDRYMVAYALAGTVLASRRRSNPVGWFLLALGLVTALRGLAGEYARYALAGPHHPGHPGGVWAAWYVGWSLNVLYPDGILTFLLLLFPDGRPVTRRWRAVFWGAAGLAAIFVVITWLDPKPVSVSGLRTVPDPTGVPSLRHLLYGALGSSTWIASFVFLALAVVSVVLRYRRSAGEERLQLKWFAYATAVSLGLIFALLPVAPMGTAGQVPYDLAIVAGIGLALPVAIGVSVLKYRLYAIDKIISRTVSYALVTGLVIGGLSRLCRPAHQGAPGPGKRRGRGIGAGRGGAVQPAASAGAITGRPAVRPRALRRRARGDAVLGSVARSGRPGRARRGSARRGRSRPGAGAPVVVAA
jgi:hypothetical protein